MTGRTAATTVSRSRSRKRRDPSAAERTRILGTPGRRHSESPALPPKETQPSRPTVSMETRRQARADTPKEWPTGGMRVGTTPTDWRGREKLVEATWGPADASWQAGLHEAYTRAAPTPGGGG